MEERVPEIRFKGFKEPWNKINASDIGIYSKGRGYSKNDLAEEGTPIILYGRLYTNYHFSINVVETYAVPKENSVYSLGNEVIIPASGETAEDIARAAAVEQQGVLLGGDLNIIRTYSSFNPAFIALTISTGGNQKELASKAQGKSVVHIHNSDVQELIFSIPNLQEQTFITDMFQNLDALITLNEQKLDKLKTFKKSCLEKMFPKVGETVPEVRFEGFNGGWRSYRFDDVVQIERGGSPRPIDEYITDSPQGLNWIKIGDAPEQGRYITRTAEKIKPEGLSKTRAVYPGDLILSNSMSFGKPYIMGIEGCIHDGWLLIRDMNNSFDLTFLCHMLSSPQMLDQYRSLAAGSTVNNLNKELVGNTLVIFPEKKEQVLIGQFLERIDINITLYQQKLDKLKNLKKALLDKMFV